MSRNFTFIALCLCSGNAGFFGWQDEWLEIPISGERWHRLSPQSLQRLLQQLSDDKNSDRQLANVELAILYTQDSVDYLKGLPEVLAKLECVRWHVLHSENLLQKVSASEQKPDWQDMEWLKTTVLPCLQKILHANVSVIAADKADLDKINLRLNHDKHQLLREIADLEGQLKELEMQLHIKKNPTMEHLLVFLPALFRNVWGTINPYELALIAGTINVPEVKSPQPEPSPDTVAFLKSRLLNLPVEQRDRLLHFCKTLPHKLEIRPEMQDFF